MQNESSLDVVGETDLLSFITELHGLRGVKISLLDSGDIMEVRTRNTVYVLKVLEPSRNEVEVYSNGKFFQELTGAEVLGNVLLCDDCLFLLVPAMGTVTTSKICSIRIVRTDGQVIELGSSEVR